MTFPKFGKSLRSEFSFHPNYVPLNHGSYGTYPKALKPILQGYQEAAEEHPDRWLRYEQHPVIEKNLKLVGQMINADPKDLAFLSSASQGANNVLRSFPFKKGDKVLYVSVQKLDESPRLLHSLTHCDVYVYSIKQATSMSTRRWNLFGISTAWN